MFGTLFIPAFMNLHRIERERERERKLRQTQKLANDFLPKSKRRRRRRKAFYLIRNFVHLRRQKKRAQKISSFFLRTYASVIGWDQSQGKGKLNETDIFQIGLNVYLTVMT